MRSMRSVGSFVILVLAVLFDVVCADARQPEAGGLFVRVVDTGPAECVVVKTPDDRCFVFDCGHWNANGFRAWKGVNDLFPSGHSIDLVVLSHSDSDHNGGVARIFADYAVREVIHSGVVRNTATSANALQAIANEPGCNDVNLGVSALPRGTWEYGETMVTILCGWHLPPSTWPIQTDGESYNAGSICVKVEFAGRSLLFCGDAVGRHLNSPAGTNIATEKYLCDNDATYSIQSDVIIASHHGANNGSSERFVDLVNPTWVVFSAGHQYQHPTESAAERFMVQGVSADRMLRTDRGDDEDGGFEWKVGSIPGEVDPPGDDDVDIQIRPNGELIVEYRYADITDAPLAMRASSVDGVQMQEVVPSHPSRDVPLWVLAAEAQPEAVIDARDRLPSENSFGSFYSRNTTKSACVTVKCHTKHRACCFLRRLFSRSRR
jgi:competence protein ComEC